MAQNETDDKTGDIQMSKYLVWLSFNHSQTNRFILSKKRKLEYYDQCCLICHESDKGTKRLSPMKTRNGQIFSKSRLQK